MHRRPSQPLIVEVAVKVRDGINELCRAVKANLILCPLGNLGRELRKRSRVKLWRERAHGGVL